MEKCIEKGCGNEARCYVHNGNGVLRFCFEHYKKYSDKQLKERMKLITDFQPVKDE